MSGRHDCERGCCWFRGAWFLVAVAALSVCHGEGGVEAAAAQTPVNVTLSGDLVFKDAHVREIWTLVATDDVVYKLPGQPRDSSNVPIWGGVSVSLDCELSADDPNVCTTISNVWVIKAAAPVVSTNVRIRLLVMVTSLTGTCTRTGAQTSAVSNAYMRAGGYADFLRACSYGKMVYNKDTVTVISTPIQCSNKILACDEDAIAAAASAVADRKINVNDFTHFSYILPNGLRDTCGWVGLAMLPGMETWYTPDEYGIFSKGTVLQETLHNFGIWHGWKNGVEYEDFSTSMGRGDSCPSGPELWRLGWVSLLAQLNSTSFPAKTFKRYTVPATYLGPDKVVIKIQPDWLGTKGYNKNVYLALRVKAGGDEDLLEEFNQKVNVHDLDSTIDNNFYARGDPYVTILGTIDEHTGADFPRYKLFVLAEELDESATQMVVKVCRYIADKRECLDGPSSSPPPPLKKPPPKRPPPPVRKSPPPPVKRSPPPPPPKKSPPPPLRKSPPPPLKRTPPPPPKRSPPPPLKRSPPPSPPPKKSPPPPLRRPPPPSPLRRPPPPKRSPPPPPEILPPPHDNVWPSPDNHYPTTLSPPDYPTTSSPPGGEDQSPPNAIYHQPPSDGGGDASPPDNGGGGGGWRPPNGGDVDYRPPGGGGGGGGGGDGAGGPPWWW